MSDCTPNLATIESAYVNWALLADRGIDASEAAAEFDRFIADVKADALREAKDSVLAYDGSSFLRYLKETDRAVVEQWLHECAEKIEGDSNE